VYNAQPTSAADDAANLQYAKAKQAEGKARQEGLQRDVDNMRARKRSEASEFVKRHQARGWTVLGRGTITKVGNPPLTAPDGRTGNVGYIWQHDGNLYVESPNYPMGLEVTRTYPYRAESGAVIWWDDAATLRLFEPLPYAWAEPARQWAIDRGYLTPPKATRKK
jgi:hypothetical protein